MSSKALAWAIPQQVGSGTMKCVLLILADTANQSGICWPSQEYLSKRVCVSTDTIQRALKGLEELGMIERTARYTQKGRRHDAYMLRLDRVAPAIEGDEEDPAEVDTGEQSGTQADTDEQSAKPQNAVQRKAASCGSQSRNLRSAKPQNAVLHIDEPRTEPRTEPKNHLPSEGPAPANLTGSSPPIPRPADPVKVMGDQWDPILTPRTGGRTDADQRRAFFQHFHRLRKMAGDDLRLLHKALEASLKTEGNWAPYAQKVIERELRERTPTHQDRPAIRQMPI